MGESGRDELKFASPFYYYSVIREFQVKENPDRAKNAINNYSCMKDYWIRLLLYFVENKCSY